jgi:S1-C subfamily serine protease
MIKPSLKPLVISLLCLATQQLVLPPMAKAAETIVEADAQMVANCKFLGSVRGFSIWGAGMGADRATKVGLKKALELGATHVVWGDAVSDASGMTRVSGKAYLCDPAALTAKPNPPAAAAPATASPAAAPTAPSPSLKSVYQIANQSTVLIDGQAPGSGVIISRVGNTYYVLTAKHTVATRDEYTIVTANAKKFPIDYNRVRPVGNLDLALVQFTSNEVFSVARLGNSEKISQGDTIFVSGWPAVSQAITRPTLQVTDGRLTGLQQGDNEGYELTYNNATAPGMSGGPVFDANGRLIGIHGRAAGNQEIGKVGINLGIPIHLFLRQAPRAGLNLQQLGIRL